MVWQRRGVLGLLAGGVSLLAQRAAATGAEAGAAVEAKPLLRLTPLKGAELVLDRAALEALPQVSFATSTIWTEGVITFSGPSLRVVLERAGIKAGQVALRALNDYQVNLALEELAEDWPIIATRRDGQPFDIRENGPLWLVYPYDSETEFTRERIYTLSIWQLVQVLELPE